VVNKSFPDTNHVFLVAMLVFAPLTCACAAVVGVILFVIGIPAYALIRGFKEAFGKKPINQDVGGQDCFW
jgi:hypothetical protein